MLLSRLDSRGNGLPVSLGISEGQFLCQKDTLKKTGCFLSG